MAGGGVGPRRPSWRRFPGEVLDCSGPPAAPPVRLLRGIRAGRGAPTGWRNTRLGTKRGSLRRGSSGRRAGGVPIPRRSLDASPGNSWWRGGADATLTASINRRHPAWRGPEPNYYSRHIAVPLSRRPGRGGRFRRELGLPGSALPGGVAHRTSAVPPERGGSMTGPALLRLPGAGREFAPLLDILVLFLNGRGDGVARHRVVLTGR